MFKFNNIPQNYLNQLAEFLQSYSWIFEVFNTLYIKQQVLQNNQKFLSHFDEIKINEFLTLKEKEEYQDELNDFIRQINYFKINFDVINTDTWIYRNNQNKLSMKKLYEIENIGKLIKDECDDVEVLVDLGSGLGYLDEFLHVNYQFKIIALEGCEKNHLKAIERQKKYYPQSIESVKHVHHFVTVESGNFIINEAKGGKIGLFGLHPCGDLSVTAINLFLLNEDVRTIVISPCCYHKMSGTDLEYKRFINFPLSRDLKNFVESHSKNPFLRSFLRLAGQQSPEKILDMTNDEHFTHGKRMFERAVVEAILNENEVTKRVNNVIDPQGRLTFEDIKLKYKINDEIPWNEEHEKKFNEIRLKIPRGEEQSEILSCLQSSIQNCCENLVIVDRIFYIKEQGRKLNLDLKINVKKLQNDKLTPRCHVFVIKKV